MIDLGELEVVDVIGAPPFEDRLGILVLPEGFTEQRLPAFRARVDEFAEWLSRHEQLAAWGATIAIKRVDVASGASGFEVGNVFGTRPAADHPRMVDLDHDLIMEYAMPLAPGFQSVLVLVDDESHRGCALGQIAVTALAPWWKEVALHELGHSAFGLADEYSEYPGSPGAHVELAAPNVTRDVAAAKWQAMFTTDPVTVVSNPDCTTACEPGGSYASVVGSFEGASYYHCGAYRSQLTCLMRTLATSDFCTVCAAVVAQRLAAHAPPSGA